MALLSKNLMNFAGGLLALFIMAEPAAGADTKIYFASPGVPNIQTTATSGIALLAGGHIGTGTDAPRSASGTIVMTQSAIGFLAATPAGYPGSFLDTTRKAVNQTNQATRYRFFTNANGILTNKAGVVLVPQSDGTTIPVEKDNGAFTISGTSGQNAFDEPALHLAIEDYRLAVRLNPLTYEGYRGLVRIARERVMARLVQAYALYLDSARFRALPAVDFSPIPGGIASALALERAKLVESRVKLEEALAVFVEIARDPIEGLYLQPQAPFGLFGSQVLPLTPLADESSRLFECYVRSLALATEIEEKLQRLDYLTNYRDPLSGPGPATSGPGSAFEIRSRILFYEDYLTLACAFNHCESFSYAPLSRVRSGLGAMATLVDDVALARLAFGTAARQGGSGGQFVQTSFAPSYVPFLTAGVSGSSSSRTFENLYYLLTGGVSSPTTTNVGGTLGVAVVAEAEAATATQQVIDNDETLKTRNAESLIKYNGALIELCGSTTSPDGKLIPDLRGYLFPPDIRQEVTGTAGAGAVAAQYARIGIARTGYDASVADFKGILQRIEITEQGAAARAGITRQTGQSLARIYTAYGEEFALLDKASAEISAEAERQIARAQADAQKRSRWSKLAGIIKPIALVAAGVVLTVATAGTAAPAVIAGLTSTVGIVAVGAKAAIGVASEIEGWSNYNKQGKAILKSGDIKAKSIEALGRINQQQTRLRAAESVEVAIISADGQARIITETAKEEIRKLVVEMERSKLNILLAEQQYDLAELELANLFERVGYLLEEYQEVVRQLSELPLNRPDFRYVRDYRIQLAEDQFRTAQMWTYLTLKSAQYRFMTSNTFSQVSGLIETTLKCRNSKELLDRVINVPGGGLATLGSNFYLSNGFSAEGGTKNVVFSLKDHYFSSGFTTFDENGQLVPYENTSLPPSYGSTPETASDAYFQEILSRSITGGAFSPKLTLTFSTSFDERAGNPLNDELRDQLGHVILSGGTDNRKGIFINIRGTSLPQDTYSIRLRQVGTTYLTYRARSNASEWSALKFPVRVWSLPERFASVTAYTQKNMNPNTTANAFIDQVIGTEPGFDERSPYCDRWELEIDGATSAKNRRLLTTDLTKIKDIQLGMSIKGFNPQLTTP